MCLQCKIIYGHKVINYGTKLSVRSAPDGTVMYELVRRIRCGISHCVLETYHTFRVSDSIRTRLIKY